MRSVKILLTLGIIWSVFLLSCSEDQSSISADSAVGSDNEALRATASQFARVIAYELRTNIELRREVLTKMAYRFDGDRNIRLDHLSDKSAQTIESAWKELGDGGSTTIAELRAMAPRIGMLMPFFDDWDEMKISAAGGLVVAVYPFGVDDRSIRELSGFNADGESVTFKVEEARSIPYILIRNNERTDDEGYLTGAPYFVSKDRSIILDRTKSLNGMDPKNYAIDRTVNIGNANFRTISENARDLLPILFPSQCGDPEGCGGGGGGGGGTMYSWKVSEIFVGDSYEAPTEGEIEIYFKVIQYGNWQKSSVTAVPYDVGHWRSLSPNVTIASQGGGWLTTPVEMWDEDDIWDDCLVHYQNNKEQYSGTQLLRTLANTDLAYPQMGGYADFTKVVAYGDGIPGQGGMSGVSRISVYPSSQ